MSQSVEGFENTPLLQSRNDRLYSEEPRGEFSGRTIVEYTQKITELGQKIIKINELNEYIFEAAFVSAALIFFMILVPYLFFIKDTKVILYAVFGVPANLLVCGTIGLILYNILKCKYQPEPTKSYSCEIAKFWKEVALSEEFTDKEKWEITALSRQSVVQEDIVDFNQSV